MLLGSETRMSRYLLASLASIIAGAVLFVGCNQAPSPPGGGGEPSTGVSFVYAHGGQGSTYYIDSDGRVWRHNADGGTSLDVTPVLFEIDSGEAIRKIDGGDDQFVLALGASGQAWGWGDNQNGELGIGTAGGSYADPRTVLMPLEVSFVDIAAGDDHALAVDHNGDAWAWGNNTSGELGTGSITANESSPAPVSMPAGVSFTDVSAGNRFSLAIDSTGGVWAWGDGGEGQLGRGSTTDAVIPVKVDIPIEVVIVQIDTGIAHGVALDASGTLWAWGRNSNGQAIGVIDPRYTPTNTENSVPSWVEFVSVSVGDSHNLAIDNFGQGWAWGYGPYGRLGTGNDDDQLDPTQVVMPPDTAFAFIDGGNVHSSAIDETGQAWWWGRIGRDTNLDAIESWTPRAIPMPE